MVKVSRPWSGKKDSLPNQKKKEQHADRKTKKLRLSEIREDDWQEQLKEYNAIKSL